MESKWIRRILYFVSFCVGSLLLGGLSYAVSEPVGKAEDSGTGRSDAEIAQLIEQLGDSQYHAREKAQEQLHRIGVAAFDALLAAQEHTDIEIAMRARYLVRSMPIAWVKDSDPAVLKQLFKDYSNRDREERATRAKHFSKLDDVAGTLALCRIARFDFDRILSKEAAVLALNRPWPDSEELRQRRAAIILEELTTSKRTGAEWLRLYARTLEEPAAAADEWDKVIRSELAQLAKHPQNSDRELAVDLIRWDAQLLLRVGKSDEAIASMRRTYDLLGDSRRKLYEMLDWSVENNLHHVADELAAHFSDQFKDDPMLLYRLAESQRKREQHEPSEETAQRARKLAPLDLEKHFATAEFLQLRALTEWAEMELQQIVEQSKPDEEFGAKSRLALSEMYFDLGREFHAAETVKVLVEALTAKPQALESLNPDMDQLRGYMHYYYGMHYAKLGDRAKQIENIQKAITDWPDNPDFLIAMFRVPDPDEALRKDIRQRLESFGGSMRKEIRDIEGIMLKPQGEDERRRSGEFLANKLNELAWLISNTEGDFQEALKVSLRSLELKPDSAAYLDTLGRCYYAVGDYENAVKVQTRAVKLMPSMNVMRRQLSLFEKSLAESKSKSPK